MSDDAARLRDGLERLKQKLLDYRDSPMEGATAAEVRGVRGTLNVVLDELDKFLRTVPPAQEAAPTVTRVEVIDESGRQFVRRGAAVQLSYQDQGRTLKVFTQGGEGWPMPVAAAPAQAPPAPPDEFTEVDWQNITLSVQSECGAEYGVELVDKLERLRAAARPSRREPSDICTCGHQREGHHVWGRCHGERCKCSAFVLDEGPSLAAQIRALPRYQNFNSTYDSNTCVKWADLLPLLPPESR